MGPEPDAPRGPPGLDEPGGPRTGVGYAPSDPRSRSPGSNSSSISAPPSSSSSISV